MSDPQSGHCYVVALGSNVRHPRHGVPRFVMGAALAALEEHGAVVEVRSAVMTSRPLGPSRREYANSAAMVRSSLEPPEFLALLKEIEAAFGRRERGLRWQARVLDLDIVLWSGGVWAAPGLIIPHPAFRQRGFVLSPVNEIAGQWRDPVSGFTVKQLFARLNKAVPDIDEVPA